MEDEMSSQRLSDAMRLSEGIAPTCGVCSNSWMSSLPVCSAQLSVRRCDAPWPLWGRCTLSGGRCTLSLRRSTLSLGRSTLSLGRSTLSLGRSTLSLRRSTLSLGRSTLSLGRSTLSLGRSTLSLGRSTLSLGRSTLSGGRWRGPRLGQAALLGNAETRKPTSPTAPDTR
ncbi:hypothetical protein EYF80_031937 [Liparis tanakae]|uniref:Uncharacterized protein n=1 Tax=Liparis tanakae TaxID=230148 RepID=A0A4Z2GXM2_9TELE|nr:hypothetical protein EYF80_031937 [Liparis tanakae]